MKISSWRAVGALSISIPMLLTAPAAMAAPRVEPAPSQSVIDPGGTTDSTYGCSRWGTFNTSTICVGVTGTGLRATKMSAEAQSVAGDLCNATVWLKAYDLNQKVYINETSGFNSGCRSVVSKYDSTVRTLKPGRVCAEVVVNNQFVDMACKSITV